jgi:hypothetical protein
MLAFVIAWLLAQLWAAAPRKHEFAGKTKASREAQLANLRKGRSNGAKKGERRALKHGGNGNGQLSAFYAGELARVREIAAEHAPWLLDTDVFVLEGFAEILAVVADLRSFLERNGTLDDKGKPWPAVGLYLRARSKASQEATRLGFSPQARQAIGLQALTAKAMAQEPTVKPVRSPERSRAVLTQLFELGILGDPSRAEVSASPDDVTYGESGLSEDAARKLGIRPKGPTR